MLGPDRIRCACAAVRAFHVQVKLTRDREKKSSTGWFSFERAVCRSIGNLLAASGRLRRSRAVARSLARSIAPTLAPSLLFFVILQYMGDFAAAG